MTVRNPQAAAQLTRIRGVGCAVGVLVHLRTRIQMLSDPQLAKHYARVRAHCFLKDSLPLRRPGSNDNCRL